MLSKHYFLATVLGGIVVVGNSSLAEAQTVGPNGEAATPSSALTLTDAEVGLLAGVARRMTNLRSYR